MTQIDVLTKTAFFQSLPPQDLQEMAQYCHQSKYAKNSHIFAMSDTAECFFIIIEGWVKLYRMSREGLETVVHVFGPGESFAEAAVFNDRRAYPVDAQAVEDTILLEIPRSLLARKIEQDSGFAFKMLGAIASRQHYLIQQLEQVTTRTAPQRVGAFLLRFCQKEKDRNNKWIVKLPYDRSLISTRLNIKPETFSRALSKLKPHGVEIDQRNITISDPFALADFCDIRMIDLQC